MATIDKKPALALTLAAVLVVALIVWLSAKVEREAPSPSGAAGRTADGLSEVELLTDSARESVATPNAAPPEPLARAIVAAASLTLCVFPDGATPTGTRWALESVERVGARIGFQVEDVNQPIPVPPGRWRVVAETDGWAAIDQRLELVADERAVVWVGRRRDLRVRVTDPDGSPIVGADVAWLPLQLDRASEWNQTPAVARFTDVTGSALLESIGVAAGELCVHAAGFVPSRRSLIGSSEADEPSAERLVILERADLEGATLRVLHATTKRPLAGARLWLPPHVVGVSNGDGTLVLPAHIDDQAELAVDGPSHARVRCLASDLRSRGELSLYELGELLIRLQRADGATPRDVLVWAEVDPSSAESDFLPDLELCEGRGDERVSLAAPVELPLQIFASGVEGEFAQARVTLTSGLTHLQLLLTDDDPLCLAISDEAGRPLAAVVDVQYAGPSPRNVRREGERVAIPFAERITQVLVFAPGHVPARLHPIAAALSHAGELRVSVARAHDARVRTVDTSGRGVPGMCVRAWAEVDHRALAEHPTLNGGVPTSHPGWSRNPPPARQAWTDSQGRCTLAGLATGPYRLHANFDNKFQTLGVADLLGSQTYSLWAPVDGEVEWRIDAAQLWEIRARDAGSGRGVSGLAVKLEQGGGVTVRKSSGAVWLGWIPAAAETVGVSAEHHRETPLVLDERLHPGRIATVDLEPGGELSLALLGGPALRTECIVKFRVFERRDGYSTQVTEGEFAAPSEGLVTLAAPLGPMLEIELAPTVVEGSTWQFEPRRAPLDAGAAAFTWIRR